jgi:hypothetical protein
MPVVLLDSIVGNSRAEDGDDGIRFIRAGTVSELPHNGSGSFDWTVLPAALATAGVPQVGDPHPQYPAAKVIRRIALPCESADTVKIEVHYGSPEATIFPPDNSFKIIRDSTVMSSELTELDWDGNPIQVFWYGQGANPTFERWPRTTKMQRLVPLNSIIASGTIDGRPSIDMLKAQGRVNNSAWQGLGAGYWLCSGLDVFWPATGNKFLVTATFLSKLHIDWGGYGRYEYPDNPNMPTNISASEVRQLRDAPYNFGPPNNQFVGLVKAHIYGPADIGAIFPISN